MGMCQNFSVANSDNIMKCRNLVLVGLSCLNHKTRCRDEFVAVKFEPTEVPWVDNPEIQADPQIKVLILTSGDIVKSYMSFFIHKRHRNHAAYVPSTNIQRYPGTLCIL